MSVDDCVARAARRAIDAISDPAVGPASRCGHYREDGDEVTVSDASVIRVWGTANGLGELVDGPTKSTVLDSAGTVRAHRGAVVLTIDADATKWEDRL